MRKVNIVLFILFILFLITYRCAKKEPVPIVAKVGTITVTVDEFRNRYEFTPQIKMTADNQRNKRAFITSLLGEKILAEEGYHRNLHKSKKVKIYAKQMEKEAIVEELFQQEIASKIEITQQELKDAYVKSKQELQLQVLNFDTAEDAKKAKELLSEGRSFQAVKNMMQQQAFISADSVLTLPLKWGEAHPDLEDAAFKLQPDAVSEPIKVDNMYFIIKLIHKSQHIFLTEPDFYQQIPDLKKVLRARKSAEKYDLYFREVMKDTQLRVPHEIFNFVADELIHIYAIEGDIDADQPPLQHKDPEHVFESGSLKEHLDDTFATFNDGATWTVGEFLTNLSVGPYPLDHKSKEGFTKSLRRVIRRMAEFEALAQRGYKSGIHNTAYVKYQTQMWRDAYIAQEVKQTIIDTVKINEEEAHYFYTKNDDNFRRPEMLKLQEILIDDRGVAIALLRRIKNGEDMGTLARQYSQRELSRDKNGISGFFTTQAWGEIGKVASSLKSGEFGGPLKTENNQYAIFKLIDKKPAGIIPFDEVKNDAGDQARSEKSVLIIDEYLTDFFKKYDVQFYKDSYDSVEVSNISMAAFKRHYPNRFVAPPVTPLFNSPRWQDQMDAIIPK